MLSYRFSHEQRLPIYVAVFGLVFFWLLFPLMTAAYYQLNEHETLTMLEFVVRLWPYWIVCAAVSVLAIMLFCRCGIACYTVTFSQEGVAVTNRSGKPLRYLAWQDIVACRTAQHPGSNQIYVCLTTNGELPMFRTQMYGIIWALFYDRNTITLPGDDRLILFCHEQMEAQRTVKK